MQLILQSEPRLLHDPDSTFPALWALRLLSTAATPGQLAALSYNDRLRDLLGLTEEDVDGRHPQAVCSSLRRNLGTWNRRSRTLPDPLASNLAGLSVTLELDDIDAQVLALLAFYEADGALRAAFELLGSSPGVAQMARLLAAALELPVASVRQALSEEGALCRSGLLVRDDNVEPLCLLSGLSDMLLYREDCVEELLSRFSTVGLTSELDLSAFAHIQPFLDDLRHYVMRTSRQGVVGVNVLIHGSPGTGKTQLVRALSADLGLLLHEVLVSGSSGHSMHGLQRVAVYRCCQRVLARKKDRLLLFDEVEDVFGYGFTRGCKAAMNTMLELNPRPAFWLSNDIDCLDPSLIRRFDLVFEMPDLQEPARLDLARRKFQGLSVGDAWLRQLAQRNSLQPGHLATLAKVATNLGYSDSEQLEPALDHIVESLCRTLGEDVDSALVHPRGESYDPTLSCVDIDAGHLISGLRRSGHGRLCLYGPPGTGKTAFARYLAAALERPLYCRKASDLLEGLVGGSEKRLAAAFAAARRSGAVLLIDEADSFLGAREAARHSWEITLVNELLVQMEQFSGVLVMATNHMEYIDAAALRRFDFKLRFGCLSPDQVIAQFDWRFGEAAYDVAGVRALLSGLELVPGDFSTVERQYQILGEVLTPEKLSRGLISESEHRRSRAGRRIGF